MNTTRRWITLGVSVVGLLAVGCAGPALQVKLDEMTRECDDLKRQKAQTEADLMMCKARCASLERGSAPPKEEAAPAVPDEFKGKIDIRRRGDDTVIELPSDVFFSSGSSQISKSSEKSMEYVVQYLKTHHPSGTIRVGGHADTDPIVRTRNKYHCNWELSFDRAHAVMHYLQDKGGVDPHRLVCESYGEFQPQDAADKAKNRRVEIIVGR